MSARIDLTGKKFGAWTVISYCGPNSLEQPSWICECDCGVVRSVVGQTLRIGTSVSCGCQKPAAISKARLIHGQARSKLLKRECTRTYGIWSAMHNRCRPANKVGQKYYVAYGVTVCERWASFENFLADMGEAPEGLSIDRYPDNNGNYEPGNCRWATAAQQNANRRQKAA